MTGNRARPLEWPREAVRGRLPAYLRPEQGLTPRSLQGLTLRSLDPRLPAYLKPETGLDPAKPCDPAKP